MTNTTQAEKTNWEAVRPVVIYFAGERFVVEYAKEHGQIPSPIVALVHAYIGTSGITNSLH
jgi:hypothetical protein